MAKFKLSGPDGGSYIIDAPDEKAAIGGMRRMFGLPETEAKKPDERDSFMGKVDAAVRGAADTLTFGFADELSAAGDAALQPVLGTGAQGQSFSDRYGKNVEAQRAVDDSDYENRFGWRLGGQIGGGVAGGLGAAASGLSLGANAARAGEGLGRVMAGGAADGLIAGALQGFGSGRDMNERGTGAAVGGALGAGIGGLAPAAVAGLGAITRPVLSPIAARLNPERFTGKALGEALTRSGRTPASVEASLMMANQDGQGVWNVGDALGHTGQRLMSTAVRNPNNARETVVEALMNRQAGQGRRIAGALAEGFDAPDTADARTLALTRARDSAADVNYSAARENAGAVDVSGALARIDEVLAPGASSVMRPGSTLADDSIEGVLTRVRRLLGNGREQVSDFTAVLRAKQDIDDLIGKATRLGANNQARLLTGVRNELDNALASASAPYAGARSAFRQGSRQIEAVDAGRSAAQRGRPEDTTFAFAMLSPEEQAAFRAGYADPLIAQTQTAATGVNKARPLINDATSQEFPAFASPGRADQLQRRIGREQTMFETNQTALGGSKTADNLADAIDMNRFDPGVMSTLLQGRPVAAVIQGVTNLINARKGMPPQVLERVARTLIETRPDVARAVLEQAHGMGSSNPALRALANSVSTQIGAAGFGRVVPTASGP